jgi:hypothetical protein
METRPAKTLREYAEALYPFDQISPEASVSPLMRAYPKTTFKGGGVGGAADCTRPCEYLTPLSS